MSPQSLLGTALLIPPGHAGAAEPPFDPFEVASIESNPGASVPLELLVHDSTGRETTIGALADGKPILLVPVLRPNICGVTLGGVADAAAGQDYQAGRDFASWCSGTIRPRHRPTPPRRGRRC